jgi:hypothetical protein
MLLRTIASGLGRIPSEKAAEINSRYFGLLKSANATLRDAAALTLSLARQSLDSSKEFTIPVMNILGDVRRDVSTTELLHYRPVLDALMGQADLFSETEWQEVGDLSRRLLSQTDQTLQELGISICEKIPHIPESSQEDLVHLLMKIETTSSPIAERASRILDSPSLDINSPIVGEALTKRRSQLRGD